MYSKFFFIEFIYVALWKSQYYSKEDCRKSKEVDVQAAWRRWYLKMKKIWILCIQQNILAKFLRGKLAFKNTKILWPRCKKMPFLKAALDKKKEKKKLNKTWKYSVTFSVFKLSTVLFNKSLECIIDVELKGMYFLPVVDRIEMFSIFLTGNL